jgi:hypothetical protein
MYVWSGSAWVSVATEVESLATYATQSYADNTANVAAGLKPIVPSSVVIGSGSSSVSTLGQVTFTGASSVSLNNVFSSTYDNYKVLFSGNVSTAAGLNLRLRVGGVDNSTASSYLRQFLRVENTVISGGRVTSNIVRIGQSENTLRSSFELTIYNPFQATATPMNSLATISESSVMIFDIHSVVHNVTSSFDGFTLIPESGTTTGTISVYGYKKG